ncbi:hypothetical protein DRO37_05050 [Candidatus Bathyarchaeota archaeon]|nr:MAG: hypothetical protein DRO37_05050 [Candidatus Bathyarchaeota archaeon]
MKNLEIGRGIHLIKCPWSTYFVSSCILLGESIILVDVGTQDSPKEAIYPYIRGIGRDPSEISHIILTHAHFDHCGGASIIKKDTGCKVLVHKFGRPYLEDAGLIDRELHERFPSIFPARKARFESISVDGTFEDGDILDIEGRRIRILHTPGHSACSSCIIDEEIGIYISGDSIQGRGDRRPLLFHSAETYIRALRRLLNEPIKAIVTGHPFPPFKEAILRGEKARKHIEESLKGIEELQSRVVMALKNSERPLSIGQIRKIVGMSQPVTIGCILEDLERKGIAEKTRAEEAYLWSIKKRS